MDAKQYLEYLDKEMTIMGILSAVSVVAPAGIMSTILTDHSEAKLPLWNAGQFFVVAGSVLCVAAALWFYKERSLLAWYYGQICLAEALADKKYGSVKVREWLREADSWETWWPYSWGFTFLITGFVEYLLALFFTLIPSHWYWLFTHLHAVKVFAFGACPVAVALVATLQWYVLTRYKFSDDYWTDFRSDILERLLKGRKLPHDAVYTRLKPSRLHGVGVFAIKDIPKGTYIFEPDDDSLASVRAEETRSLEPALQQLYKDFSVLQGDTYECPSSFNRLTPAWYLNTSKDPNVAADLSLKFYAVRFIGAGEELTTDYSAYSDDENNN